MSGSDPVTYALPAPCFFGPSPSHKSLFGVSPPSCSWSSCSPLSGTRQVGKIFRERAVSQLSPCPSVQPAASQGTKTGSVGEALMQLPVLLATTRAAPSPSELPGSTQGPCLQIQQELGKSHSVLLRVKLCDPGRTPPCLSLGPASVTVETNRTGSVGLPCRAGEIVPTEHIAQGQAHTGRAWSAPAVVFLKREPWA